MNLMIDHYDSFTFNLVQVIAGQNRPVLVRRNDQITLEEIIAGRWETIFLSPGPCSPQETGITPEVIRQCHGTVPMLGVCLGHQTIAYALGGRVIRAGRIMHGKTCPIFHDGRTIYEGLPNPFEAIRYHSLIVERDTLPECLEISAWSDQGEIMGLRHRDYPVEGVQFHPESILTPEGNRLIQNFFRVVARENPC
ncbi:MAG: aminodeoxychorismate/anthranilate synthase component II [Deltaproteobacteria bacterium]|nr:aminodeoxychorismate/anthranilate synthase component II [Deltaproteobacteria bacterium]